MSISEYNKYLNQVRYVEDLATLPKTLRSNSDFIEKVLLKLGKREDFIPDRVLDYVGENLQQDTKFIISTFYKVISLKYTDNELYENYFEAVSYYYFNYIRPLLKDETLALKLIQGFNKLPILKNPDFLFDVNQYSGLDTGSTDENVLQFLIRNTIEDTQFKTPSIIKKVKSLGGSGKFLEEQFVNSEVQQIFIPIKDENSESRNQPLFSLTYYLNEGNPDDNERVVYWLLPIQPFDEGETQKLLLRGYDVLRGNLILKQLKEHPENQIAFQTQDGNVIKVVYHSK